MRGEQREVRREGERPVGDAKGDVSEWQNDGMSVQSNWENRISPPYQGYRYHSDGCAADRGSAPGHGKRGGHRAIVDASAAGVLNSIRHRGDARAERESRYCSVLEASSSVSARCDLEAIADIPP